MKNAIIQVIVDKTIELQDAGYTGAEFFDKMDEWLSSEEASEIWPSLLSLIPDHIGIVLTGGSGRKIVEKYRNTLLKNRHWTLFAGGIRNGAAPKILDSYSGDTFVYDNFMVDDSIYGGKTFLDIKKYMEERGGKLSACYVVYDGSPVKRDWIFSIFRYYDFFKVEPNFKFD